MNILKAISAAAVCFIFFFGGTILEEGMWLLDATSKLPLSKYKKVGYELTAEKIYSKRNPSIKDAIILLPGGTGSFISDKGLILTNHHIAFAGIQELSNVHDDYLKTGFLANTEEEELSTSYTAEIVAGMSDVTAKILSGINEPMTTEERSDKIKTNTETVRSAIANETGKTVRISEMYNGAKYYAFTYDVLKDIRLVYAPPEAIGVYGGEVDNWIWPRHTGDFAFLRAYVGRDGKPAAYAKENVPFTPRSFLPISTKGITDGSFAIILGFPGRTFRYRDYGAVKLAHDETLPTTADLYKKRVDIIDAISESDRSVGIKYATKGRRLANAYKNYLGTLEGMRRANLLLVKKNEGNELGAFIAVNPGMKTRYGTLMTDINNATEDLQKINRKNILFSNIRSAVEALGIALKIMDYSDHFEEDSVGEITRPSEEYKASVLQGLEKSFKDFDLRVDREMLVAMIMASSRMPLDQRALIFKELIDETTNMAHESEVREYVEDLYQDSKVVSLEGCKELLSADHPADIDDDPFVQLARRLSAEQRPLTKQVSEYSQKIGELRRKYSEAYLAWKKGDVVYPDANRTLRLSYGTVQNLKPRDAVTYNHLTTLTGVMEKETGVPPFDVPAKLKELWKKKDFGRYADPKTGDIPVAFIANLDITGGNSGSPVLNGRGEVIGCSYDGNWESIVADYYFQDQYNRAINVDSRYMLFILDKFSGGTRLLNELVIR
ncbi:MAG TPA: S46 family peptidase [Bacteroidota bacterium]